MNFGNNIEQLGFEKSGWVIIDQSADGNTVYMGKPSIADAKPADAAWHIRKVTTETQKDGSVLTIIQHSEPHGKCVWADRKNLEYLPVLKDIRKVTLYFATEVSPGVWSKEYSFEYGMTWREWVESEYNVDGFMIKTISFNIFNPNAETSEFVVHEYPKEHPGEVLGWCYGLEDSYPQELIREDIYYFSDASINPKDWS
jgi:hypothetical protein